jgi:hypothetical protein
MPITLDFLSMPDRMRSFPAGSQPAEAFKNLNALELA